MSHRNTNHSLRHRTGARRGFSLIETVLSVVLVGGLFVAALNTTGAAAAARRTTTSRTEGMLLAQDLMAEIRQQLYDEPSAGIVILGIDLTNTIGPDSGEGGSNGLRTAYDDVDDYDGWSGSPQTKAGVAIAWAGRYAVSVEVKPVELDKPWKQTNVETGVKRITVTVKRAGKEVARLSAYRSRTWGSLVDN